MHDEDASWTAVTANPPSFYHSIEVSIEYINPEEFPPTPSFIHIAQSQGDSPIVFENGVKTHNPSTSLAMVPSIDPPSIVVQNDIVSDTDPVIDSSDLFIPYPDFFFDTIYYLVVHNTTNCGIENEFIERQMEEVVSISSSSKCPSAHLFATLLYVSAYGFNWCSALWTYLSVKYCTSYFHISLVCLLYFGLIVL